MQPQSPRPEIRSRIKPFPQRIRHTATATELKDWLSAKLLQVQQEVHAEITRCTKLSADKLAEELTALEAAAAASSHRFL